MSGALLWSNRIVARRACARRAPTRRGEGERKRLNGRNKARRAVIGSYYTSFPPLSPSLFLSLCPSPSYPSFSPVPSRYRSSSLLVYLAWPTGATQAVGDTLDLASTHHSHARDDVARLRYLTQCRPPYIYRVCVVPFVPAFHRALRSTLFAKRPEASCVNGER